jgi:hypothetical protein
MSHSSPSCHLFPSLYCSSSYLDYFRSEFPASFLQIHPKRYRTYQFAEQTAKQCTSSAFNTEFDSSQDDENGRMIEFSILSESTTQPTGQTGGSLQSTDSSTVDIDFLLYFPSKPSPSSPHPVFTPQYSTLAVSIFPSSALKGDRHSINTRLFHSKQYPNHCNFLYCSYNQSQSHQSSSSFCSVFDLDTPYSLNRYGQYFLYLQQYCITNQIKYYAINEDQQALRMSKYWITTQMKSFHQNFHRTGNERSTNKSAVIKATAAIQGIGTDSAAEHTLTTFHSIKGIVMNYDRLGLSQQKLEKMKQFLCEKIIQEKEKENHPRQ